VPRTRRHPASRPPRQLGFKWKTWGGKRRGAGRPPNGKRPGVPHEKRPAFQGHRHPLHVTVKMREHVFNLRSVRCFRVIHKALATARNHLGLRIIHFSVQGNHIHFLVEAADRRALARGMQGLAVRLARGLNRVMGRRGTVFADRYHARPLRSPTEVAIARRYALGNAREHVARRGQPLPPRWRDEYCSLTLAPRWGPAPVVTARTWLLRAGWRRAHPPPEMSLGAG